MQGFQGRKDEVNRVANLAGRELEASGPGTGAEVAGALALATDAVQQDAVHPNAVPPLVPVATTRGLHYVNLWHVSHTSPGTTSGQALLHVHFSNGLLLVLTGAAAASFERCLTEVCCRQCHQRPVPPIWTALQDYVADTEPPDFPPAELDSRSDEPHDGFRVPYPEDTEDRPSEIQNLLWIAQRHGLQVTDTAAMLRAINQLLSLRLACWSDLQGWQARHVAEAIADGVIASGWKVRVGSDG